MRPRSHHWLLVLAAAGLASPAAAQDLPSGVDDPGLAATTTADPAQATGWACTRSTLSSGSQCIFEGAARPLGSREKQKKANAAVVETMAPGLCAAASRPGNDEEPSKDLVALCKADFKKASAASCELDGAAAIVDARGRFTSESKPCYFALGEVLRNTSRIATTGTACCRCAVAQSCTKSAHACLRFLGEDPPVLPKCAAAECFESCSHMLPHASPVAKKPRPDGAAPNAPDATGRLPPYPQPSPYPQPMPYSNPPNPYTAPLVPSAGPYPDAPQ
ncbi:MAG TPA: hypothetical protein VGK67_39850 [Myxococcales bacterium]|jgi:hypothetical protein